MYRFVDVLDIRLISACNVDSCFERQTGIKKTYPEHLTKRYKLTEAVILKVHMLCQNIVPVFFRVINSDIQIKLKYLWVTIIKNLF